MRKIFLFTAIFHTLSSFGQDSANAIRLNQLGFYPMAPKIAVLAAAAPEQKFFIVTASRTDTVFSGQLGPEKQSLNSSAKTRVIDFSTFHTAGNYRIAIAGFPSSYTFSINPEVLHSVALSSLKGFYYIRSGMPLEKQYAGKWARAAGHPDNAVIVHGSAADNKRPEGTVIPTPGGWYDAGDYNKYVVNSGISTGTLLSAFEDFSHYFDTLRTNIPESADKVPDIINEVLYNLRWMMSMQDPGDGGVYNKCTNAAFDGMVMPDVTKLPRFVVQKGTAATLDFAAVMAQCARIARKMDRQLPGLADSCRRAAERAWDWAVQHPAQEYNQDEINRKFTPKITTGGYGDRHFDDEWYWAATELFLFNHAPRYRDTILRHVSQSLSIPSWNNVNMLAVYSLVRNREVVPADMQEAVKLLEHRLLVFADSLTAGQESSAFHTVMGRSPRDFTWGSNSTAANQGVALVNAWLLSHNKKYMDAALGNLDYLLGRNATGYCFVTGTGTRSTLHPHHRPSVADGIEDPVPGLLAGGPNPGRQDKSIYRFTEPETAYLDSSPAYASNEIAINWNAPLVYLANAIEAMRYSIPYDKH